MKIIVNIEENHVIVSKAFYKRASIYGTAEYDALRKIRLENPNCKIEMKAVRKKTYNGLTFKTMEDYIKTQLARVCGLSRTTAYKYIGMVES